MHRYALSACAAPGAPTYPTLARALSNQATAGLAATIKPAAELARGAHLPLRLTETNSVTCGGVDNISDVFATALWAPDALFEFFKAGARSVAVHVRANAINMAFALTNHGLVAYPLLYGLIVFARTLGSHPRLLHEQLKTSRGLNLKAWAVADGSALRLLLINKSAQRASITLALPVRGSATVQRLTAPSARSELGVTLDGQRLGRNGRWLGRAATQTVVGARGEYHLSIGATSAVLVTAAAR